jgi:uncharacterized iron-regulated protein
VSSIFGKNISRDEWMAESITEVFETNPNAKMLIVAGKFKLTISVACNNLRRVGNPEVLTSNP